MSDRQIRAALDQLRGALRERLLDEEQGHLDPLSVPGSEPRPGLGPCMHPDAQADDPGPDSPGEARSHR